MSTYNLIWLHKLKQNVLYFEMEIIYNILFYYRSNEVYRPSKVTYENNL